jgi:putative Mg2+ transporter-C (MgtC) family protein
VTLALQIEWTVNLFLAAALSMVIGLDREQRTRSTAGTRTHMLVGVAACLFTLLSLYAFEGDTGRIAAQIVSGIGFLGAGAIFMRGGDVHNLTTAASIWAVAAIGMAVGSGAWLLAVNTTLIVWFILEPMRRLTKKMYGNGKGTDASNNPKIPRG